MAIYYLFKSIHSFLPVSKFTMVVGVRRRKKSHFRKGHGTKPPTMPYVEIKAKPVMRLDEKDFRNNLARERHVRDLHIANYGIDGTPLCHFLCLVYKSFHVLACRLGGERRKVCF